ncbi:4-hydroxy-tetrahydrodipicolinate synthase, partial [Diaphorobacter sp.]|uniref:4-hydroxy-tetrahydrodipicolinate synthase n=1 Tax=Diaphorobacter sp. TaxID=1934310 RepID=UPI002586A6F0
MAGVGANSTAEAVALARFAQECGADSLLSVVPYYNKPTQQGLVAHFTAQADAAALPLVLYNVPGRTVIDLQVDTMAALARHPRIVGIKDATGDMARAADVAQAVPPGFAQYSGDDFTSLPYLALGGQGVISVLANVLPAEVAALCAHMEAGRLHEARALFARLLPLTRALFARLLPLTRALFMESSPGPAKYAAQLRDLCGGGLRLPMCEVSSSTAAAVSAALQAWPAA